MRVDGRLELAGTLLFELVRLASPDGRARAGVVAVAVGHQVDVLLEDARADAAAETARVWQAVVDARAALLVAEREAAASLEILAERVRTMTACITH
jgi:hypothetical protein